MADNVQYQSSTLATPAAGVTVATDDVSGAQYQRVKLDVGDDGVSVPVTNAAPLPIGTLAGGTVQMHGTVQALGTFQSHGTNQALGTVQPLAGSVHVANTLTGTFQQHGTNQALGTFQPLAGSVHVANTISGTFQAHGTSQVIGTVQLHGTNQALGTFQPLAGSVHLAAGSVFAQGVVANDSPAAGNPVLIGAFGSSGTQAAVGDGDVVRLWADLNGRLQVRGTIDSLPNVVVSSLPTITGTVQTHGTSQVLGTVQPLAGSVHLASGTVTVLGTIQAHGTTQALGTMQPLAGSVHLATNLAGGTVVSVGSAVHDAPADTRPHLIGAFGSSGTQVAVGDGDAVRLWADVNGRLQIRGTIDSLVGTVQTHGTSQVLGSVQTVGTSQALGTFQPLAGSVHVANTAAITGTASVQGLTAHAGGGGSANPVHIGGVGVRTRPGTVSEGSVVRSWFDQQGRQVVQIGAGTIEPLGTMFGGAGANGTIRAGLAGSYMRIHDIVVSGSAAGTFFLLENTTARVGPLFLAANGGWNFNSATGLKLTAAGASLVATFSAGSWSVFINYSFEGM